MTSLAPPETLYNASGAACPPLADRCWAICAAVLGVDPRHGPAGFTHAPIQAKFVPPASDGRSGCPRASATTSAATGSGLVVRLRPAGNSRASARLPESLRLSPKTTTPLNGWAPATPAHPSARTATPVMRWRQRDMDVLGPSAEAARRDCTSLAQTARAVGHPPQP